MIPGWVSWEYVLQCEALHYLLGFSVGSLTCLSILTIYLTGCMVFRRRPTLISSEGGWALAVFFILFFSLSASLVSHVLEDYWFSFF